MSTINLVGRQRATMCHFGKKIGLTVNYQSALLIRICNLQNIRIDLNGEKLAGLLEKILIRVFLHRDIIFFVHLVYLSLGHRLFELHDKLVCEIYFEAVAGESINGTDRFHSLLHFQI